MFPGSLNQPIRKREEKCRRKEGKSQCRRGGTTKSKLVPVAVQIPQVAVVPTSKSAPSPAPTPTPIAPPTVSIPVVVTVPVPISGNLLHKDPHAMSPSVPVREGKAIRRKAKEKEKEPPRTTTLRQKKNSATQSVSIEVKCSSETDGSKTAGSKNEKKKKSSQTSSDMENKSDGSKEPSENDDKKKFNKEAAKNFFKHMLESTRARKRSDDARLETMPESSQINVSARALRKKTKKAPKSELDTNFFKPNGEPVWVVPENSEEKTEDGTIIKNPELAKAMAEEELELDEKNWFDLVTAYMGLTLQSGPTIPADYNFDPFASEEQLEAQSQFVSHEKVSYNTVKNIVELSDDAIRRFSMKRDGMEERVRPAAAHVPDTAATESLTVSHPLIHTVSQELFQPKSSPGVTFNIKSIVCSYYDRQNPITSVQNSRRYSTEQSTQMESKERA